MMIHIDLMENQFFKDQQTHSHNTKFLRNMVIYDLRRASQPFWDPMCKDQNDIAIAAVADYDENEVVDPLTSFILKQKT